jgi:hypothetical protein
MGIAASVLLACGGGAWVAATPVEFSPDGADREVVVARCVGRARELGYSVDAVDYQGGSLRLTALSTTGAVVRSRPYPKSASWLVVKVEDDQTVSVRAYGDLVEEEEALMHPKLRSEMDWVSGELERAVRGEPPPSEAEMAEGED